MDVQDWILQRNDQRRVKNEILFEEEKETDQLRVWDAAIEKETAMRSLRTGDRCVR